MGSYKNHVNSVQFDDSISFAESYTTEMNTTRKDSIQMFDFVPDPNFLTWDLNNIIKLIESNQMCIDIETLDKSIKTVQINHIITNIDGFQFKNGCDSGFFEIEVIIMSFEFLFLIIHM